MANCPQCNGLLREEGDEASCVNCGRTFQRPPASSGNGASGPVKITVELTPKTLPELYSALAQLAGKVGTKYLSDLGTSYSKANEMMKGNIIEPRVAVKVMEQHSISPSEFVRLMKATVAAAPAERRGGGRRRKEQPNE